MDYADRGKGVLTLEEMRRGESGLCVATQIGRYVAPDNPLPGWNRPDIAWSITQALLAWYRVMEDKGLMTQIRDREALNAHVQLWESSEDKSNLPIGYVLSLEGADSIIDLSYLEKAYEYGLRAIGPAHYGPGGTHLVPDQRRPGATLQRTATGDGESWHRIGCRTLQMKGFGKR